jgi:hypothetical protein
VRALSRFPLAGGGQLDLFDTAGAV